MNKGKKVVSPFRGRTADVRHESRRRHHVEGTFALSRSNSPLGVRSPRSQFWSRKTPHLSQNLSAPLSSVTAVLAAANTNVLICGSVKHTEPISYCCWRTVEGSLARSGVVQILAQMRSCPTPIVTFSRPNSPLRIRANKAGRPSQENRVKHRYKAITAGRTRHGLEVPSG